MRRPEDLIKSIITIWALYPVITVVAFFRGIKDFSEIKSPVSWIISAITCVIVTLIFVFVHLKLRKSRLLIKEPIKYEEFVELMKSNHQKIKLKYRNFFIEFEVSDNLYIYQIYKEKQILKQGKCFSLNEMCELKILANQTIKELWNEIEVLTE